MNKYLIRAGLLGIAVTVGLSSCSGKDSGISIRTDDERVDTRGNDSLTGSDSASESSSETQGSDTGSGSDSDTPGSETSSQSDPLDTGSGTAETDTETDYVDADSDGWPAGLDMDCNDSDSAVNPSATEDTDNGIDDDCDGKIDEQGGVDTEGCDGQEFAIEFLPTNLMILLDMSTSMLDGKPSKWEQARAAIISLVTDWNSQINFGLDIFPDSGTTCGVAGAVTRDVAPNNATNIVSYLNGTKPSGSATPICLAIHQLSNTSYAPGLYDGNAGSYVALVSDGQDNCSSGLCSVGGGWLGGGPTTEDVLRTATQALTTAGARVFVIGFGDGVSPAQLNAVAEEGGTGITSYLDASDQTELHDALASIASTISSCSFELKDPNASADPDEVNFFFDGLPVPFDPSCATGNGWDWTDATHTAILFCDSACTQLKDGSVAKISAEFGCDQIAN